MTKPSHRPSTHVQPVKPETAEKTLPPVAAPPPEQPPIKSQGGGLWFATVIWTLIFALLFGIMLINLIWSILFRK
jgi:hypothetical protein